MSTPRPFGPESERRCTTTPSSRPAWPTSWASTGSGASSTTSWRSTRTARRPRWCWPRWPRRPERIRVGHGAVVCVPEMNHPIRVAERAAALDIVSGGRLEFGTARSLDLDRARRLQRRPGRHQEDVGRVRPGAAADVGGRAVRLRGALLLDAGAQRAAQAGAEAASADVGHGHQPRHRARRGRAGSRLPRRRRRRLRRAGAADPRVPPAHPELRPGRAPWSTTRSRP